MSTEGSGASRGAGDGIHNEDVFLVEDGLGLYVVCDGASGTAAGEIAARIARDAVAESIRGSEHEVDASRVRVARLVVEKAMARAMRAVASAEQEDPELSGLATTITMLLAHRNIGVVGHRGDSRAYLIRRDRGQRLTVDHELSESATRDGHHSDDFDVFALELRPRDTVVLCTDGAEEVVEEVSVTRGAGAVSPRILASRIVGAARRRDPRHDATAVVVRIRGESEPGWLELSHAPEGTSFGHTLELQR